MTAHASLLVRGRIATFAGDRGMGWVEALAVRHGRVVAAGPERDLEPLVGPRTRSLELGPDDAAMPALADAHLHLLDAALAAERVDVAGRAPDDALARVAAAHRTLADPDAWLEGDGWDAGAWGRWPVASELERAAPGRLAALWAHDRHSLWVSERAMREARLSATTVDPSGGVIRRAADGTPSGILHETAAGIVLRRIPRPSVDRRVEAVARLADRLVRAGLTAVHDPGPLAPEPSLDSLEVYRRVETSGRLSLDVVISVRRESLAAAIDAGLRSGDALWDGSWPPGHPDRRPRPSGRLGWLKLFADGSLGSRTAAMLEPFEPDPLSGGAATSGVFQLEPAELADLVARAAAAGIAPQVHAIGDAAVRAALDAIEGGMRSDPDGRRHGRSALLPRIEHAQLVDPADLTRFGDLGVVASVQPIHIPSDAAAARRAWGRRAERAYPYRSLREAGAILAFGTDAPIEHWDPWPGIEVAVTRRGIDADRAEDPLGPAESLDLPTALRAVTLGPTVAAARGDRGRLVPGSRADLVVVPAAALAEPVESGGPLGRVRPSLVLVAGREFAGA